MKDEIITECGTNNSRNNDNLRHKKEKSKDYTGRKTLYYTCYSSFCG